MIEPYIDAARTRLEEAPGGRSGREVRSMTLDQAADYAMEDIRRPR